LENVLLLSGARKSGPVLQTDNWRMPTYFVSIVGFRYGSKIAEDGISFTEMEFRQSESPGTASPSLFLADSAKVPMATLPTFKIHPFSSHFDTSILSINDVTVKFFRTTDELKAQLLQSIWPSMRSRTITTDLLIHSSVPWMVPNLTGLEIHRDDLFSQAISILSQDHIPRKPNSLFLEGPGGFGKNHPC